MWQSSADNSQHDERSGAAACSHGLPSFLRQSLLAMASPQGLANTAYAFAIAGMREEELLAAVAEEALPRVREFSPQALATTAFAYATLRTAAPELMDAVGRRCVREAGNFTPQEIANTLWAFARMGQKLPTMLEGFADQVMRTRTEGLVTR